MNAGLFSSKSDEWATPRDFYKELDAEFHFDLDPCSTHDNAKCALHYTIEDDGLTQNWGAESLLQSAIWERDCEVGEEVLRGKSAVRGGCNATPCEDRYTMVPFVYLWQSKGNPLYPRPAPFQRIETGGAIPVNGGYILRSPTSVVGVLW